MSYRQADFSDFQFHAGQTAIYPQRKGIVGLMYAALGLAGEAGEVANKVKKIQRDRLGLPSPEDKEEIAAELGDVLWYVAETASNLDLDLNMIASGVISKLRSRQARGVLKGSGDSR